MLSQTDVGVGLRKEHYTYIESQANAFADIQLDWFEVLTENYLFTHGRPRQVLDLLKERFPISCHGVSLNLASVKPLDTDYLTQLKQFVSDYSPALVSDHLCWTGWPEHQLHNLLPFPYTQKTLSYIAERIMQVQSVLQRQIAVENLSAYFAFSESEMTEGEFLAELSQKADCLILLDVNNLYVNSCNYGFSAETYLKSLPAARVAQYHLAGFQEVEQSNHEKTGSFLFDTHSAPVYPQVWELYQKALIILGARPTLIEWDDHVPDFDRLQQEALTARAYQQSIAVSK